MKLLNIVTGASALVAFSVAGAYAQSGQVARAVAGYDFGEAAQEAPGTKDFHSADGHLTFAIVTHTAGNGFFDPVYVGATVAGNLIGANILLLGSESPTDDPAREIEILNQIVNDPSIDGIIMTTPQVGAYDDIVRTAYANGIPVATTNSFDPTIFDRNGISHTGQDASAAAIAGEALVNCLIDRGVTSGSIILPNDTAMGNIEVNNRVSSAFNAIVATLDANGSYSHDAVDESFTFGGLGNNFIAGDFDGDGFDEIGTFPEGTWRVDMDGDRTFDPDIDLAFVFGTRGHRPVVGDWDGDGRDEIGVFQNGSSMSSDQALQVRGSVGARAVRLERLPLLQRSESGRETLRVRLRARGRVERLGDHSQRLDQLVACRVNGAALRYPNGMVHHPASTVIDRHESIVGDWPDDGLCGGGRRRSCFERFNAFDNELIRRGQGRLDFLRRKQIVHLSPRKSNQYQPSNARAILATLPPR